MDEITLAKQALRGQLRPMRRAFTADERRTASAAICAAVCARPEWQRAHTVLSYVPMADEADVSPLLQAGFAAGKAMLLPRCEKGRRLSLRRILPGEPLEEGRYGIPAPPACAPEYERAGLVILPALAFSLDGRRLGYGGGYYDRLFERMPEAVYLGVCDHRLLLPALPCDAHDLRADILITDRQVLTFPRKEQSV